MTNLIATKFLVDFMHSPLYHHSITLKLRNTIYCLLEQTKEKEKLDKIIMTSQSALLRLSCENTAQGREFIFECIVDK